MGKSLPKLNITNKEAEKILNEIVGYYGWTMWDDMQSPPRWKPFKERVIEAMEMYLKEQLLEYTQQIRVDGTSSQEMVDMYLKEKNIKCSNQK